MGVLRRNVIMPQYIVARQELYLYGLHRFTELPHSVRNVPETKRIQASKRGRARPCYHLCLPLSPTRSTITRTIISDRLGVPPVGGACQREFMSNLEFRNRKYRLWFFLRIEAAASLDEHVLRGNHRLSNSHGRTGPAGQEVLRLTNDSVARKSPPSTRKSASVCS